MLHIINRLQLSDTGLVVKGTKQEVHLQQGTMDGACAVYSMMMCLIIIRSIHRKDVVSLEDEKINGNTAKGRLIRTFLHHNGFVRSGYYLDTLKDELLHSYKKMINAEYFALDNDNGTFLETIIDALKGNNPVELGFQRKGKTGHAVVAVGYEENSMGVLLYTLDPSCPMPSGQYWNNVFQINRSSNRKYNTYNFIEDDYVQIDEALVIKKNGK
jgi:hypothetical protein